MSPRMAAGSDSQYFTLEEIEAAARAAGKAHTRGHRHLTIHKEQSAVNAL